MVISLKTAVLENGNVVEVTFKSIKGALIIHEVLVAMGFFPAGVQDETLKEESQSL